MKILGIAILTLVILLPATPLSAQITKPVYISLPSAGNVQHVALGAAKYKGFYEEMGVPNAQVVFLRGNSVNVQAIVSGSVQFASAFGPSMHTMFRGEQLRILVQIFNQIPFGLITKPEVNRLEDLKGARICLSGLTGVLSDGVKKYFKNGLSLVS